MSSQKSPNKLLTWFLAVGSLAAGSCVPSRTQRVVSERPVWQATMKPVALFDELVAAMERLDGDGLIVRESRPESWKQTLQMLRNDVIHAENAKQVARVFRRLDATYPNLHARLWMRSDLDPVDLEGRVVLPIRLAPDPLTADGVVAHWRVASVEPSLQSVLHEGDLVVSLQGHPMHVWELENRVFCKLPLASQCALELSDSLRRELLSWTADEPLRVGIERNGVVSEVVVRARREPRNTAPEPVEDPCRGNESIGTTAMTVRFRGEQSCLRASADDSVAVLRIQSFRYAEGSPSRDVDALWNGYWKEHAGKVKNLVIDVVDNHGGDEPIAWYRILLEHPFQEQFVSFKRIAELDVPKLESAVMWNDPRRQPALRQWRSDGTWERVGENGFLPPVPQFCASESGDCREGLFVPKPHQFRGNVRVLMNQWCVSSCSGFVWQLGRELGDRVRFVGVPDAGDTTYSRLSVVVGQDSSHVTVIPAWRQHGESRREDLPLLVQTVSVSRTTDAQGHVISGVPQRVDVFAPPAWNESLTEWKARLLNNSN